MNKELQEQGREASRRARLMKLTLLPLDADLKFASAQLEKNFDSQFWRRTLIRCLLAITEALLWNMKNVAPSVADVAQIRLTTEELQIVSEKRVVMKDGKSETRPYWLKFRDNVKASFTIFAKAHGATVTLKDEADFDAFCQTYELRSRLMHPKKPFDLAVSDVDIKVAQRGADWFSREYTRLMNESGEAVPEIVGKRKSEK